MSSATPYTCFHIDQSSANLEMFGLPRDVVLSCHPDTMRVIEKAALEGIEQRSQRWYDIRKELIVSGSILNSIVGTNKYEPPWKMFCAKVFRDPEPFRGNAACEHGQKYEGEALQKLCEKRKCYAFEVGLVQHPVFKEFGGSADGITSKGELVEIKCPLNRWITPGKFPEYYDLQPQFYMWLFDLGMTGIPALFEQYKPASVFGTEVLDIVEVPRDNPKLDHALAIAHEFVRNVKETRRTGILPPEVHKKLVDFVIKKVEKSHSKYAFEHSGLPLNWSYYPQEEIEYFYQEDRRGIFSDIDLYADEIWEQFFTV